MIMDKVAVFLLILALWMPFCNSFAFPSRIRLVTIARQGCCGSYSHEVTQTNHLASDTLWPLQDFLTTHKPPAALLQGAFALEDEQMHTLVVDCSNDLHRRVTETIAHYAEEKFHAIRIQTFNDGNWTLLQSYAADLARETRPILSVIPVANFIPTNVMVSPFAEAASGSNSMHLELTAANVEAVLDTVRPFLIMDGGNIALAAIDHTTRSIELILEGACGSCPSSTTTMKMGVERAFREHFADLGTVTAIKPVQTLSSNTVEGLLAPLLPAIQKLGGKVVIRDVDTSSGVVTISFTGPPRLKKGVELVLKDMKDIKGVVFVDEDQQVSE